MSLPWSKCDWIFHVLISFSLDRNCFTVALVWLPYACCGIHKGNQLHAVGETFWSDRWAPPCRAVAKNCLVAKQRSFIYTEALVLIHYGSSLYIHQHSEWHMYACTVWSKPQGNGGKRKETSNRYTLDDKGSSSTNSCKQSNYLSPPAPPSPSNWWPTQRGQGTWGLICEIFALYK